MNRSFNLTHFRPLIALVIIIWAIAIVNLFLAMHLNDWFGLRPRSLAGIPGIVASPFLHKNFAHLISNTMPLILLGSIMTITNPLRFVPATISIILIGGALTWLSARGSYIHVGASGLIFGYFGYLVTLGIIERRIPAIIGACAALFLYGGLIWGIFPQMSGRMISWEGHLFGLIGGVITANILRRE